MLAYHLEPPARPAARCRSSSRPVRRRCGGMPRRRRRTSSIAPRNSSRRATNRSSFACAPRSRSGGRPPGWLLRPLSESSAIIESAVPLAEQAGDRALLGQALFWRALLFGSSFRPLSPTTELGQTIERGLEIADELGDRNLRGNFLTVKGTSLNSTDPQRAVGVLEEALTLTSDADFIGSSLTADQLARTYAALGDWDKADETLERAKALAERSGDPKAITDAAITGSGIELERGNTERAIAIAKDAGRRAEAIGAPACSIIANWIAGTAEMAAGRPDDALASFGHSNQLSIQLDERWFRNYTDAGISDAQCAQGDIETARPGWERALAFAAEIGDVGQEADIRGRAGWLADRPRPRLGGGAGRPRSTSQDLPGALGMLGRVCSRAQVERARALEAVARRATRKPRGRRLRSVVTPSPGHVGRPDRARRSPIAAAAGAPRGHTRGDRDPSGLETVLEREGVRCRPERPQSFEPFARLGHRRRRGRPGTHHSTT